MMQTSGRPLSLLAVTAFSRSSPASCTAFNCACQPIAARFLPCDWRFWQRCAGRQEIHGFVCKKAGNGVTCLKVFQDMIARWRWAEWPFGHYVTDKLYTTL
jgi:hypothetical protein